MNKVLEFVMYYIMYLVTGFLGMWFGNLIIGADINPFTSWIPYVLALVITLYEIITNKE